jgi:hypothetical protein
MSPELISEMVPRTRAAWSETMFLHMRELRYGISPCKECGKELIWDAQWQAISWQKQKKIDDALP